MEEIKSCLHCGSDTAPSLYDNVQLARKPNHDGRKLFAVCCSTAEGGCGCCGCFDTSKEAAIAAWNRRTAAEGPEVNESLADYLDELFADPKFKRLRNVV